MAILATNSIQVRLNFIGEYIIDSRYIQNHIIIHNL